MLAHTLAVPVVALSKSKPSQLEMDFQRESADPRPCGLLERDIWQAQGHIKEALSASLYPSWQDNFQEISPEKQKAPAAPSIAKRE